MRKNDYITLTRTELKYLVESLTDKELKKILKSKHKLNEVLLNWEGENILNSNPDNIISAEQIKDEIENRGGSEPSQWADWDWDSDTMEEIDNWYNDSEPLPGSEPDEWDDEFPDSEPYESPEEEIFDEFPGSE